MIEAKRLRKFCNLCALDWLKRTPNFMKLYSLVTNLRKSGRKKVSKSVIKSKKIHPKNLNK